MEETPFLRLPPTHSAGRAAPVERRRRRCLPLCAAVTTLLLVVATVTVYHNPFLSRKAQQLVPVALGVAGARLRGVRVPLVVEHPKCGRTWLKCILGALLLERLDGTTPAELDSVDISDILGEAVTRVFWKHGRASFDARSTPETIEDSSELAWRYALVHGILLVRDPRDTVVSSFYQIKYRQNRNHLLAPDATLAEYIYQDYASFQTYIEFLNQWAAFLDGGHSSGWISVRYENLRSDGTKLKELQRIAQHMNLRQSNGELLAALDRCSFDHMKQDAATASAAVLGSKGKGETEEDGAKVRKGEVAGYLTELSVEDSACLDRYMCLHLSDAAQRRWGYGAADCSSVEIAACDRWQ